MSEELADIDYIKLNRDLDITKSKVFLQKDASFFAPLMCGLDFLWDEKVETAASNSTQLFWAPNDFIRCRDEKHKEDESTLMHELWHVARLHDLRCGSRDHKLWNYACDIWINRELKKAGYYIGIDWVLHPGLDHIEVEEDIYDILKQQSFKLPPGGHCSHCSATPASKQQQIAAVVKAVQAAKFVGDPGSIPGSTESMLDKFLSPIIPWEQHLYQWMQELGEKTYTWRRPSRRGLPHDMYMPTRFDDVGRLSHLLYFQDVSGSITDPNILRFNSELKYVWDVFQPKKMTIAQFDTRITRIDEFEEGDPYEKIKIVGRGGTSLVPVRALIEELRPTAAIIFTDMYVDPMQPLTYPIPILWVSTTSKKGHGGKTIHIKDE